MIKRALLSGVAALALGSAAVAADLPVKAPVYQPLPMVSWAGLYIDIYGLYAANTTDADVAMNSVNIANVATSPHGPGIGGALGYNFQPTPGGVVFGARADIAYANIQGGGSITDALSVSNATNWLGDFDGLIGIPLGDGKLLAYGVAGFAFGGANPNVQVATVAQGINSTSTGWNAGLGLKYMLTPNWVLGIEGDYFQLGDKTLAIPLDTAGNVLTSNNKFHIWMQKATLSYKF